MMQRGLRRLHRGCGVIAAVGVLWMAATGLLLQLAPSLHWDRAALPAWLAAGVYGATPESAAGGRTFIRGNHRLAGTAQGWWFDGRALAQPPGAPRALWPLADLMVAVGDEGVMLLTEGGELVEQLLFGTLGLGAPQALRATDRALCVRDALARVACTDDGSTWRVTGVRAEPVRAQPTGQAQPDGGGGTAGRWVMLDVAPAPASATSAAPPTWERLLQDLHAWRFVGRWAPAVGGVIAMAIGLLAVSGMATWIAGRRRRLAPGRGVHRHGPHHRRNPNG